MSSPQPSKDLSGKIALVTGAGTGFGQAVSVALCRAGARVVGVGRRSEKLSETARLAGPAFIAQAWDISRPDSAARLIDETVNKAGGLHILVNNAAVMFDDQPISELPLEDWEKTLQTNVTAVFALTQAAFRHLRAQKFGRVLNFSSGLGFRPMLEYGSYCVSKAAVNMLTRVFAIDGEKDNILVNAIDPGVARTEMNTWATESPETVNEVALFLAGLPDGGPTGACFNKRLQTVAW